MRKFIKKTVASRIAALQNCRILSVLIEILVLIHRTRRRAKTLAITLAGVRRFELRLLSGRHEMRVSFQILDDFLGYHLALKTTQRALD